MHAAKPERWHCQKGGGIEYTVKKYTATDLSEPGQEEAASFKLKNALRRRSFFTANDSFESQFR